MSADLSVFNEVFPAYESRDAPSAVLPQHKRTVQRFDPYSPSTSAESSHYRPADLRFHPYSSSSTSKDSTGHPEKRKRVVGPTPTAAAATEIVFKNKNSKNLKQPKEDYGIFDPSRPLIEDPTLTTHNKAGKQQFWHFLLCLLMDSSNKEVISWTGSGREFVISSISAINVLWSSNQGLTNTVKEDTIMRNLRACYKRRIMMPVNTAERRYAFKIEPSTHLGISHEELSTFIARGYLGGLKKSAVPSIYPTPSPSTSGFSSESSPSPTARTSQIGPVTHGDIHSYQSPAPSTDSFYGRFPYTSSGPHTVNTVTPPPTTYSDTQAVPIYDFSNCPITPFDPNMFHSFDSYWTPPTLMPSADNPVPAIQSNSTPPATTLTPAQFKALDDYFAEYLN